MYVSGVGIIGKFLFPFLLIYRTREAFIRVMYFGINSNRETAKHYLNLSIPIVEQYNIVYMFNNYFYTIYIYDFDTNRKVIIKPLL